MSSHFGLTDRSRGSESIPRRSNLAAEALSLSSRDGLDVSPPWGRGPRARVSGIKVFRGFFSRPTRPIMVAIHRRPRSKSRLSGLWKHLWSSPPRCFRICPRLLPGDLSARRICCKVHRGRCFRGDESAFSSAIPAPRGAIDATTRLRSRRLNLPMLTRTSFQKLQRWQQRQLTPDFDIVAALTSWLSVCTFDAWVDVVGSRSGLCPVMCPRTYKWKSIQRPAREASCSIASADFIYRTARQLNRTRASGRCLARSLREHHEVVAVAGRRPWVYYPHPSLPGFDR